MPKSIIRRFTKKIFIIANLFVAIFFLIGCYSKWFYSAALWPVGLLSLAAFYLLVVLLGFFIFWIFVRSRWSLIFVVTFLLALNPIRNIIPFRLSSEFNFQKKPAALRVMSWNVAQFDILNYKKSTDTYNKMISLVNEYQPDIACFQEMVCADTLVNLNTSYYRRYPFFSIYEFVDKLKFPHHFYCYNFKEDYFDHQHFGIIIFSKYPIINEQIISPYPHDYNSIFQYADIVKGNDTIRVFNLHLQSLKFSPTNLQYIDNPSVVSEDDIKKSKNVISKFKKGFLHRQLQADRVKAAIDKSPYPVIVCGDFNDLPNSYAYEKIGDGLQNSFEKKGSGIGRTFSGISPTLRIDNIFVSEQYPVDQYTCIRQKLSDHFPIIADIVLEKD